MQKKLIHLLTLLAITSAFSSCRDTPEALIQDQVEHLDTLTETLENYDSGKITSTETEEKIEQWALKWEAFDERLNSLKKQHTPEEITAMYSPMSNKHKAQIERFIEVRANLDGFAQFTPRMQFLFETSLPKYESYETFMDNL